MFRELASEHRARDRARRIALRQRERQEARRRRENPITQKAIRPVHRMVRRVLARLRGAAFRGQRLNWWAMGRWEIGQWRQDANAQAHIPDDSVVYGWVPSVTVRLRLDAEGRPTHFEVAVRRGECVGGETTCDPTEAALVDALKPLCAPL